MIWIDSQELENRLANGNLSDKEGFEYLLANLIMFTLIPYLPHSDFKNELFLWIEAITSILFIVILVRATFHINSNGDGKEYLKRFLSLFFVTATRLVVYAIIAAIPIGLIDLFVKKYFVMDATTLDILNLSLEIFFDIVFYFLLTNAFKRIKIESKFESSVVI